MSTKIFRCEKGNVEIEVSSEIITNIKSEGNIRELIIQKRGLKFGLLVDLETGSCRSIACQKSLEQIDGVTNRGLLAIGGVCVHGLIVAVDPSKHEFHVSAEVKSYGGTPRLYIGGSPSYEKNSRNRSYFHMYYNQKGEALRVMNYLPREHALEIHPNDMKNCRTFNKPTVQNQFKCLTLHKKGDRNVKPSKVLEYESGCPWGDIYGDSKGYNKGAYWAFDYERNLIFLKEGVSVDEKDIEKGKTVVCQTFSRSAHKYVAAPGVRIEEGKSKFSGVIKGISISTENEARFDKFPPGTQYISSLLYANYNQDESFVTFVKNFSSRVVPILE